MIINNYIIMLRHIITEEQGFSTSLNDSFAVLNSQNKSISIEKQDQKHQYSQLSKNKNPENLINTINQSPALLNKLIANPQSLYTFSSLYQNNHQDHYQPIYYSLSKHHYTPNQTIEVPDNNLNTESKVPIDLCKIFNDELHDKQLDRIYFFGQAPEQGNISLGKSTVNRYGKLECRSVFEQNKIGRNILKYMLAQKTQPFKSKLSDKITEHQTRRQSLLGSFFPPQIMIVSNFQSGNLHSVYRCNSVSNLYFLFLRNDTNTNGYTQWFNFFLKFQKQQQPSTLRLVIMNISKKIIYHPDMKILTKQIKPTTISASRDKSQTSLNLFIQKSQNQWKRNLPFRYAESKEKKSDGSNFMMIDFNVESEMLRNGMDFALTHPYNYSRFNRMITDVWMFVNENKHAKDSLYDVVIKQIGESVLGNKILAIQIKRKEKMSEKKQRQKNVMILARQHSSQTVGSFICESILKNLVFNAISRGQKSSQQQLFTNFTSFDYYRWYIVPLANPDGVIHGNSRTNIKGYDINRCWFQGCSNYSPETECISKYINQLNFRTNDFIIDLHGHSRQFGMFTYSAENNRETNDFNQILGKLCPYFKLDKCTYRIESSKRQTLRAQMYQQLRIRNCITIETSMYGFQILHKQNGTSHLYAYQQKDFHVIAQSILKSFDYIAMNSENEGPSQLKDKNQETKEIKSPTMLMIVKSELESPARKDHIKSDENADRDDDSDSNPEGQYLLDEERKILEIQPMIETIQVQKSQSSKTNLKSKSSIIYKIPTQKLNFINLSEIKEKREQNKKSKKKSEKKEIFLTHRPTKEKNKKNDLPKPKQLSNRQLPSSDSTLNLNPNKSKTIPDEVIENYNMRKTIRNIYKTVGQRKITSIDQIKQQSNATSQSLKFNDNHLSHKRQIKSLLTDVKNNTTKKVAIQPKTVCMHSKTSPPKNMKQNNFYPQRFLQSTLNINWKLRAQQSEQTQRKRKQRLIEQNQVYSHKINNSMMYIKPPGSKEASWMTSSNLKPSNKTSNSQLQHKIKKLEFHSKKLESLIQKTNEN